MAYNSSNRSERLLQQRRFTTDALVLSQEAFSSVFDLGVNEIYLDTQYIPTASAQLQFSGSSQNGLIVSASVVDPSIVTNVPILKYWWRKKLKGAGDGTRQVYYFTTSDPASPTTTVTSDQLIETDQLVNFVSPKYIRSADSVNTTEASTPGYKAIVYKSTASLASNVLDAAADPSTYVFDYKTGVLSWLSGYNPSATQYVYVSVYQYIGRSLADNIRSTQQTLSSLNQIASGDTTASVSSGTNSFRIFDAGSDLLKLDDTGKLWVTGSVSASLVFGQIVSGSELVFGKLSTSQSSDSQLVIGNSFGDYANKQTTIFKNGDVILSGSLILEAKNNPLAIAGGLIYSSSNEFYLGFS